MDFSNAPIAVLDADELSCAEELEQVDQPCEGVLKRSLSDPFDISGGLQLEASLERLIWAFDDNVFHGLHDSLDFEDRNDPQNQQDTKTTLDAIKSFWKISVAPIENLEYSYPLERRPITFELEDLHMADAESVSEAEFEAFSPHTDLPSASGRSSVVNAKEIKSEKRGRKDDDIGSTNFSSSSCESLSTASSNSLLAKVSTPSSHLFSQWQSQNVEAVAELNTTEDQTLTASLRWAGLQAALEAFKARHPTLPLEKTPLWVQDLEHLSPVLLRHYANELEMETGRISEQLITCLAEREELRLFREVLDDFVVLHNALQIRRRKAAEAVLANTARFTLNNLKQHLSHSVLYRRLPRSNSPGNLIELTELSKRNNGSGGSTMSLNFQTQEAERMPRGHHIGEPIEFPGLRSAFSRLSGLLTGQSAATPVSTEDPITLATRVVADSQEGHERLTGSTATRRLIEGAQKHGSKLLPCDPPWPMGRPERSQCLNLCIPIPSSQLVTWLPPRLRIVNQILQAALHESPEVNKFLDELLKFDPLIEAQRLQRTSKYLSASGFESAQVNSLQILYSSCDSIGNVEIVPRKTVSFDWRGTKEPFKILAAERDGNMYHRASPPLA